MAISIVIDPIVKFNVKGVITGSSGADQPFSFSLTCRRLDVDEVQAKLRDQGDASIVEFLADIIEDWSGVRDASGAEIPYSTDALRQLCRLRGVAAIAFQAYLANSGAKEKN